MSISVPTARRRSFWPAAVFALIGLAVLVSLGHWQSRRAVWKEQLIAQLDRRLGAAPVALPSPAQWPEQTQAADEFTRVRFEAAFLPGQEALVFTSGSGLRPDVKGVGYWVMAPARLPSGEMIIVNRGFVPEERRDPGSRAEPPAEPVEISGVLRWPEPPGPFTPSPRPADNLWFARDIPAIAAAKGWGTVAPFYVDQDGPPAAGGLPKVGPIAPRLPNNHRQYAWTWYGLALVLAAVCAAAAWRRNREARGS